MRRIVPLVLALLCASCASTYHVDPEVVHVTMQNGTHLSGTLVLVSDTACVLDLQCQSWKTRSGNSTNALHIIPYPAICRIHAPEIPFDYSTGNNGFLIGAGSGALLAAITYKDVGGWYDPGRGGAAVIGALLFGPIGMVIGLFTALIDTASEIDLDPSIPDDLSALRARTASTWKPEGPWEPAILIP